jgi:hypothetical protein
LLFLAGRVFEDAMIYFLYLSVEDLSYETFKSIALIIDAKLGTGLL